MRKKSEHATIKNKHESKAEQKRMDEKSFLILRRGKKRSKNAGAWTFTMKNNSGNS
jgi:hypothetical protein